jgi:hypothetical protein
MTDHDKQSDSSSGSDQTLSMEEFNLLVGKTKPTQADRRPAVLDFLKQYPVEVVELDDPPQR